ncbi:DUF2793 domain-containing protein [Tropicibacter naphthalenivorans]|uniref:DUF2793 domain-containing protein n=1 Tax=Tropicibacter naphthalenivorans TaxID=441103 RepID=A0A0P1H0M2_9RHOB|nr:DUF2793 domain-containing protein [Tropicibacter naphthalenivorans]CUH82635.1 hypothetical protein TRN7648_04177 [Tropicibacter naphthalenivorans]SMD09028.1 Protein of unknown function [Tropicibacter naphthalenivorans]
MSDLSARLSLPYLAPSQAQKHVTHNEALQMLDALVQSGITEFGSNTPPLTATDGAIYALGAVPTGEWAGQAGKLALRVPNAWIFITPQPGWRAWDLGNSRLMVFENDLWGPVLPDLDNLDGVGIGTSHDTTNRLAVAAPATLLTHEGAGHQVKVNKAASGDTASLLFQTNWSGRAEMGLNGDDDFGIKVSDGSTWTEALKFDAATGIAQGAAIQQSATDATPGRLMRADYGYGPATLLGAVSQSGGTPTGAVIERGSNANGSYVRWADGTQLCLKKDFTITAATAVVCYEGWTYPAAFVEEPDFVDISLSLNSADWSNAGLRDDVSTTGVIGTLTASLANLGFYSSAGAVTVTVTNCRCMAIGRWF